MKKFVIYVDFDGVFNLPEGTDGTVSAPFTAEGSQYLVKHENVTWRPDMVDAFNDLYNTGLFEILWVTTWNHAGNISTASEVMGFLPHDHIEPGPFNHEAKRKRDWTAWKAEAIIRDQEETPRPYIWIDDEAPKYWDYHVMGQVRDPGLILKPKKGVGITPEDVVKMIDWAAAQA